MKIEKQHPIKLPTDRKHNELGDNMPCDGETYIIKVYSHYWEKRRCKKCGLYIDCPVQQYKYLGEQLLESFEEIRKNKQNSKESPDYIIRLLEAEIAERIGYDDRNEWKHLQQIN